MRPPSVLAACLFTPFRVMCRSSCSPLVCLVRVADTGCVRVWRVLQSTTTSVPPEGIAGSKNERSFIAVKPDGVQRGLIGDIIQRFEQKGFKLVGLKLLHATQQQAEGHYEEHRGKPFFPPLVSFFASGPIVAMVWEGEDVIASGRKLMGATKPKDSAPGTIRGDYGVNMGRNIIHGSDGVDSAKREINYWSTHQSIAYIHSTLPPSTDSGG